jgi:tetratricopeptide (TPR) repeat protein
LDLARLTALYGDLDEGMALLKQQFDGRIDDVLAVAVGILRERRSAAPEKLDEEVSRLVRAGLRDDPESARRLVLEAEMLEVQGHFDESMAAYRKLLQRDDVPKLVRATAANNLAFLVALKGGSEEDLQFALNSVNDSIEVIGPLSDILDTRALVYFALGKYAEAADDMKLSVKVNPTPSKWYHLAAAQLGAGDQQAAIEAWKRARSEGIALEKVSELERGDLQEFMKKMDALGATAQL